MGIERNRRIDRVMAEQLLAGDRRIAGELADLLAAAASPARAGELAGEEAAAAMFRATHLRNDRQPERRFVSRTSPARLLTTKVAALLLAAGVGGVALAASTGVLPTPLSGHAPAPGHDGSGTDGRPTTSPTPSPQASSTRSHPAPTLGPDALAGLCTAYATRVGSGVAKPLDDPAFAGLVVAAGGKDHVTAYCANLLASASGKSGTSPARTGTTPPRPTPEPSSGQPSSSHPTEDPSGHASGEPDGHPSDAPTPHPGA